jgi:hypothetical protein
MKPGTYLEKRRLMAGYSLSSLARDLLLLTGFGTSRADSDFRRLRLTLASAEAGSLHHPRERIELIRAFIPLDVSLYLHLVECDRSGNPYHVAGLCQNCACSFHDPCVLHVGPTAMLGASVCRSGDQICSACADQLECLSPDAFRPVGREGPTVAEQLRELGDRIQRFDRQHPTPDTAPPFLRLVPAHGER